MTTGQEQELRELLEGDSDGGPRGGVTVADVDARVRGLRRRRAQVAGSAALAVLAVTAAVSVPPRTRPATAPGEVWTGVLAQPSAAEQARPIYRSLPFYHRFQRGGTRETLMFGSSAKKVRFSVRCPTGGYALIWLNGKLAANGRCDGTASSSPHWLGQDAAARPDVPNEVTAALIPTTAARTTGRMTEERARELLDGAAPYAADWLVTVMDVESLTCRADVVVINPATGDIVPTCKK
ncbi:hypothetical protein GCM10022419_018070 [Nonomuraea rosea]|uniref:PepSY domain-containing protein n=1 Tax=Nonomuraea rosea TaxID=638574 RepID=A0ABP6VR70_9ACTN